MDESRVLILYTGGTIGMLESPQGKKTYPGFIYDNLQSQARFNDPSNSTIFSHSSDIASFREWRQSTASSRSSSRSSSPGHRLKQHAPIKEPLPSLMPVVTPRGPKHLPSLKTPRSSGRAVRYCVYEYEHLIDSSDIGFDDWLRIATDIEANYKQYDAFIVLHGTDTMSYTASALAFLLENLGKPVILTGAQIPLSEVRNDAVDNLLGALAIAGNYVIPEVMLFFHHTLFRGCRSTKSSSFDFEAFSSPNMPPLAKVGINIDVEWQLVLRPTALHPFRVHKELCANVTTLRLFPGITTSTVKMFLQAPIQGMVLSTYGAGNCPQRQDLLAAFREATDRGVVIVNVTQCQMGAVVGSIYENGRKLEEAGVVGGADMTIECALAKLAYLLGKGLEANVVRELIGKPIRGDLTPSRPLISELSGTRDSHVRSLFERLSLLSSDSPAQSGQPMSSSALHAVGGEGFSDTDFTSLEETLNPLLLAAAAARDDASLENMLTTLIAADAPDAASTASRRTRLQGLSLLNVFTTMSPLHIACLHGNPRNVKLLLRYGASVHLRDIQGHTALFYAASSRDASLRTKTDMIASLRAAGAHLAPSEHEERGSTASTDPAEDELWKLVRE